MIKRPDCENGVVAQPNDGRDFSKRLVFLDEIVEVLNQVDTGAGNKADVKVSDRADIEGSNKMGVTIGLHSKNGVVNRVESKVDTGNS